MDKNICIISDGRKCWASASMNIDDKDYYWDGVGRLTKDKVAEFPFPTLHCLDDLELGQEYLGFQIVSSSSVDKQWTGVTPDGFYVRIRKVV